MRHELIGLRHREAPPVVFKPLGYLEARSVKGRVGRALWQCPSPWHYAERVADITKRESEKR